MSIFFPKLGFYFSRLPPEMAAEDTLGLLCFLGSGGRRRSFTGLLAHPFSSPNEFFLGS